MPETTQPTVATATIMVAVATTTIAIVVAGGVRDEAEADPIEEDKPNVNPVSGVTVTTVTPTGIVPTSEQTAKLQPRATSLLLLFPTCKEAAR